MPYAKFSPGALKLWPCIRTREADADTQIRCHPDGLTIGSSVLAGSSCEHCVYTLIANYSLCPSNLRMMVSMNVFCGATWPRRIGIVDGQRPRSVRQPPRRPPTCTTALWTRRSLPTLSSASAPRFHHISRGRTTGSSLMAACSSTEAHLRRRRHRQQ